MTDVAPSEHSTLDESVWESVQRDLRLVCRRAPNRTARLGSLGPTPGLSIAVHGVVGGVASAGVAHVQSGVCGGVAGRGVGDGKRHPAGRPPVLFPERVSPGILGDAVAARCADVHAVASGDPQPTRRGHCAFRDGALLAAVVAVCQRHLPGRRRHAPRAQGARRVSGREGLETSWVFCRNTAPLFEAGKWSVFYYTHFSLPTRTRCPQAPRPSDRAHVAAGGGRQTRGGPVASSQDAAHRLDLCRALWETVCDAAGRATCRVMRSCILLPGDGVNQRPAGPSVSPGGLPGGVAAAAYRRAAFQASCLTPRGPWRLRWSCGVGGSLARTASRPRACLGVAHRRRPLTATTPFLGQPVARRLHAVPRVRSVGTATASSPVFQLGMMFDTLTEKMQDTLRRMRGAAKITEKNVEATLTDVRRALIDADVNVKVVDGLLQNIKSKALNMDVMQGVSPGQQFIKVVYDELVTILGGRREQPPPSTAGETPKTDSAAPPAALKPTPVFSRFDGRPTVVLMAGLQGSGKTTTTAKLARLCKEDKADPRKVLLVAADRVSAVPGAIIVGGRGRCHRLGAAGAAARSAVRPGPRLRRGDRRYRRAAGHRRGDDAGDPRHETAGAARRDTVGGGCDDRTGGGAGDARVPRRHRSERRRAHQAGRRHPRRRGAVHPASVWRADPFRGRRRASEQAGALLPGTRRLAHPRHGRRHHPGGARAGGGRREGGTEDGAQDDRRQVRF
eukprot:ctg_471.g281